MHAKLFCALGLIIISLWLVGCSSRLNPTHKLHVYSIASQDSAVFQFDSLLPYLTNKTIVLLGESSHGDARTFQVKTALIRFLHQKLGFDALIFEGDVYSLNEITNITDGQRRAKLWNDNIMLLWTDCKGSDYALTKLLYDTSAKIEMNGFDCQIVGQYAVDSLMTQINSFLQRYAPLACSDTSAYNLFKHKSTSIIDYALHEKDTLLVNEFNQYVSKVREELNPQLLAPNPQYLYFNNLVTYVNYRNLLIKAPNEAYTINLRDSQSYVNLKWLLKYKYPNEKVMLWAASSHLYKNPDWYKNLGYFLSKDSILNTTTYGIGFTSLNGSSGNDYFRDGIHIPIGSSSRNSLEKSIAKNVSYAFVPLNKANTNTAQFMFKAKLIDHQEIYYDWHNAFDGIIFIRTMTPCN